MNIALPSRKSLSDSKVLILALLLALIFHLALLIWNPVFKTQQGLRPIQLETIDPSKLDALKRQNRSLLLSQPKTETEAPQNARFESDKNRKVERETRARNTDVIPRPAVSAQQQAQTQNDLSRFGVRPRPPSAAPAQQDRPPQSAAEQAIMQRELPFGAENMLNTQESVYYSFYSRLYEAIGPLWRSRISSLMLSRRVPEGEYTTLVDVILDANGNLVDVVIVNRSGIPEFDAVIPETWRKITRFPNPPKALISPDGYVHTGWNFTVHLNQQNGLQYSPPERAF